MERIGFFVDNMYVISAHISYFVIPIFLCHFDFTERVISSKFEQSTINSQVVTSNSARTLGLVGRAELNNYRRKCQRASKAGQWHR